MRMTSIHTYAFIICLEDWEEQTIRPQIVAFHRKTDLRFHDALVFGVANMYGTL